MTDPTEQLTEEPDDVIQKLEAEDRGTLQRAARGWEAKFLTAFVGLLSVSRLMVFEVCCPAGSTMSAASRDLGMQYEGAGLWNDFDMSTSKGLHRARHVVRAGRPRLLLLAPPCTADSQIQNLNQKTEEQREKLRKARARSRRIWRNIRDLVAEQLRHGGRVLVESPLGSRA